MVSIRRFVALLCQLSILVTGTIRRGRHPRLAVEVAQVLAAAVSRLLLREVAVVLKDVLIRKYWLKILEAIVLLLDPHDPVPALALRDPLAI